MAESRADLARGVRHDLALARAAARAQLDAAQERLRALRARQAAVRNSAAQVPRRAAQERDQRLRQVAAGHAATIAELSRLAGIAAHGYAPGPAGAPWTDWVPEPVRHDPGPVRIGEVRLAPEHPVPVVVPLLDRAHLVIEGSPGTADGVVAAVLLRALGRTEPGQLRLTGYDPERLGGGLAGFAALAGVGLLTFVGPGGLTRLLDELVDHIRRINETVLAGEYASLAEMATVLGRRPEPWRVAILLGGDEPSRPERAQLDRILRTGVACGVHLVIRGIEVPELSTVERIVLGQRHSTVDGYGSLPVQVDPPPAELVARTARAIAERVAAGPAPARFADLLPGRWWTESSADGLRAPLGEGPDGRLVEVLLGDYPPHALIGGPSGTGKTNLIFAWLGALATRYGPAEVEFYLLDFKEGVSFARFAPGHLDPSWLPHVRLVGVNVNTDREFGVALLRFLSEELRRRAAAAKEHDVTTLAELRAADPGGRWPRVVAVVDEFQVLLAGRDALAAEAVTRLEDLARRGRSQGIHLVLASQDVSGIEALWGRGGLVAQFTLRIALPKARRILPETNPAANDIPRYHAVVNPDSGAPEANRIVRIPAASDRTVWTDLQQRLWRRRPAGLAPPRLFDGEAVPARPALDLPPRPAAPVAVLGAAIDVAPRPAGMRLRRAPGRNLAVLGTRIDEACAILAAAGTSLAHQYPGDAARFLVACLDSDATAAAQALRRTLPRPATRYVEPDELVDALAAVPAQPDRPHFLLLYAVDGASGALAVKRPGGSGHEHLRRILHSGPEQHVHVLGWWRSVPRLREDLGGIGARLDAIGAWVALDAHGADLAPLYPHPGGPAWHPRPWRGLYFDRAEHRTAEVIIPYA